MEKNTRETIVGFFRPIYVILRFLFIGLDKILFGWVHIISQRRADAQLTRDVRINVHFLFPAGQFIKDRWYRVLPFDYASVRVNFENVIVIFTRGQGQLNVSAAPRNSPREIYRIAVIVAALDSIDARDFREPQSLDGVGGVLRPRLVALNEAFSESQYPEFKKKLEAQKKTMWVMAKQSEWELNRNLYH